MILEHADCWPIDCLRRQSRAASGFVAIVALRECSGHVWQASQCYNSSKLCTFGYANIAQNAQQRHAGTPTSRRQRHLSESIACAASASDKQSCRAGVRVASAGHRACITCRSHPNESTRSYSLGGVRKPKQEAMTATRLAAAQSTRQARQRPAAQIAAPVREY